MATRNACGLLRQLVETPAYHPFISQLDEDQATLWLHTTQQSQLTLTAQPPDKPAHEPDDRLIASYLRERLQRAGFRTDNCFALIMTTHEGKTNLAGWTQGRWDQASKATITRFVDWGGIFSAPAKEDGKAGAGSPPDWSPSTRPDRVRNRSRGALNRQHQVASTVRDPSW